VACVLVDMGWWPGASRVVEMAREAGIPSVLDVDISADARSTRPACRWWTTRCFRRPRWRA
jgi:hypothetical protein